MPIRIRNITPRFTGKVRIGVTSLAPVWLPQTVTAVAEEAPIDFTVGVVGTDATTYSVVGSMPTGIIFNPTTQRVTGSAPLVGATGGTVSFTLRATKTINGLFTDKLFEITVGNVDHTPQWVTTTLPELLEETASALALVATSDKPFSYAVTTGSLPQGITLNASTGALSGTAPLVGPAGSTYNFTARVSNSYGEFADRAFALTVANVPHTPVWATTTLSDIPESVVVNVTLSATSDRPVFYDLLTGTLPQGLSLERSTGKITGIAPAVTSAGVTYSFTIRASNAYSEYVDRAFTWKVVNVNQNPTWTTPSALGSAEGGTTYSKALVASDTDGNIASYAVVAGGTGLPTGITLNGTSGVLSGTLPSVNNSTTYTFTVRATDNDGGFTERSFTLTLTVSPSYYVGRTYTVNEATYADKPANMGQVEV